MAKKKPEEEKKKPVLSAFEQQAKASAEAKGLTYVPEAEARARAGTGQPGIFTDPKGRPFGITTETGKTFLGAGTKEEAATLQRTGLPPISEEIGLRKQQFISEQEIPRARELEESGVGAFEDAQVGLERSGKQKIAETPIGQAILGKVGLDELKKQGKIDELISTTKFMQDNGLRPDQVSSDPATQMMLSLELNELDAKMIKSGKSEVTDLALLLEGIPFKGFGVGKYLTTIPSERIKALELKIVQIGNTIRDYRMAAARTPIKSQEYLDLIEESEQEIRNAESRIKLMIIQSAYYQNAPEEVETIQAVINRGLNRIGDARNAIIMGETIEQAMASSEAMGEL